MKVPKIFVPERERLEKEVEEIVKNTIVDKVLVKDLAKELESYFERKDMAERISISFEKKVDILSNPDLNTRLEKNNIGEYVLKKDAKSSLQRRATDSIIDRLRELKPDIREEEITNAYVNSFNIVTKETAYKLYLEVKELYCDEEIIVKEIEKKGIFGNKTKSVKEKYCNPRIKGEINYAKFDKSHHETLLKILKEEGYLASVNVKEKE
jgi:hypothetical protein